MKPTRWLGAAALCLSVLSAQAQTYVRTVLDFNDLYTDGFAAPMPPGYADLSWGSQWYFLPSAVQPGQTYLALGGTGGTLIRRMDGQPFYFDGATFWSRRGLDANGSLYFVLYLNGQTVFDGTQSSKTRMRFTGTPKVLSPKYKGLVDAVALTFHKDDHDHVAMDDLKLRLPN